MTMQHVLLATDGSESAHKAASVAGEIASALGARITVLAVQDDALVISSAWGASGAAGGVVQGQMPVDEIRSMLEQQARERVLPNALAALGEVQGEVQTVVAWGHPASEICRHAAEHGVDLIIIGSHGRSGIKEALLGSVSHAVANRAPCPVTIVR